MGKIYKFYPAKSVFLTGILLFELGSVICGAAPNSKVFILGRAIAGLGSSGIFSGLMVIMVHTIPLQQRPIFQGFFGAIFAIASVIGPLVGGTFTDKVTWRWCFYINPIIGAVIILVVFLILHLPNQKLDKQATGWLAQLNQLDPIGNLVFFPGVVCLILALQWGGTQYSWKNARIIVLLILCAVLCLVFVAIQIWKQEKGTVPPRIVKQRSIAASIWFGFFNGAGLTIIMYYLPIWFQAVKGVDAFKSGIMLLPLILSTVFASLSSGFFVSKVGYYSPFFILSSIIMATGSGLLTTFNLATGHAKWIGYQVLLGIGIGFGAQQPLNVAQTVLNRSDVSTGSAVIMFVRYLGSAAILPVAENVFISRLVAKLTNLPGISPHTVINGGATDLRNLANGDDLKTLLSDYNEAIVDVLYIVVVTSSLTIFGSLFVEWKSLKTRAAEQTGKTSKDVEVTKTDESV
jgi:predicted MFS family arabinose efflux permease